LRNEISSKTLLAAKYVAARQITPLLLQWLVKIDAEYVAASQITQ
jgi:hypothetical protein